MVSDSHALSRRQISGCEEAQTWSYQMVGGQKAFHVASFEDPFTKIIQIGRIQSLKLLLQGSWHIVSQRRSLQRGIVK
jgi:hypothetical protein